MTIIKIDIPEQTIIDTLLTAFGISTYWGQFEYVPGKGQTAPGTVEERLRAVLAGDGVYKVIVDPCRDEEDPPTYHMTGKQIRAGLAAMASRHPHAFSQVLSASCDGYQADIAMQWCAMLPACLESRDGCGDVIFA